MRYRATYRNQNITVRTKYYETSVEAWEKLGQALARHGYEIGPWHMPGRVAGDITSGNVPRAGGAVIIETV